MCATAVAHRCGQVRESVCHAQGFYLPFCLLAFSIMVGGNWVADVLGILGGHLYYFLKVRNSTLRKFLTLMKPPC